MARGRRGTRGRGRPIGGGRATSPPERFSAAARLEAIDHECPVERGRLERYHERAAELDMELARYGRPRRDDSILCYRFCMEPEALDRMWRDARVVAHEVACVQAIHDATPYDAVCQDALRRFAGALRSTGLEWGECWRRCRAFGVPIVKLAAMLACEPLIPAVAESPPSTPASSAPSSPRACE